MGTSLRTGAPILFLDERDWKSFHTASAASCPTRGASARASWGDNRKAAFGDVALGEQRSLVSVRNVEDFLRWVKEKPDKANYGSPGAGSMPHLIMALVNKRLSADLRHVPYRGSAPGIQDLLGGQISAMSSPVGDCLPHLSAGKLRLLAISGFNRNPFVADVPTYRQQGIPITTREWYRHLHARGIAATPSFNKLPPTCRRRLRIRT